MAKIFIPTPLRKYTDNKRMVEFTGMTVNEVLNNLKRQHPDIEPQLYEGGNIKSFIAVFINDVDIRTREGGNTPVGAEDNIHIIPAMAGG